MTRYRKMIKNFLFQESIRKDMVELDAGVRLNPEKHRLEIKQINGEYPTTQDLYARTRITTPNSLRKWSGFFVILKNQSVSGNQITNVMFRISDGINDYYWNTGSNTWAIASSNNWNTEEEIANNIHEYKNQSIQIVINLSTQNKYYTPYVYEVRLLYDSDIIFLEDYIVRSFKRGIEDNVRPISIYKLKSSGQSSVVLNSQTPYEIIGIDAVYNSTTDPNHLSPLTGVSFDLSTKTISFPAQPIDNIITIRFIWKPHVVLSQSQDYTEIAKIPVVLIQDIIIENEIDVRPRPYVINKSTSNGFMFNDAIQCDLVIPLRIITGSMRNLHVLSDELRRYFTNSVFLHSYGQDEDYSYRIENSFNDSYTPSQKEVFTARITIRVEKALLLNEDAKPINGVKEFNVTGGNINIQVT